MTAAARSILCAPRPRLRWVILVCCVAIGVAGGVFSGPILSRAAGSTPTTEVTPAESTTTTAVGPLLSSNPVPVPTTDPSAIVTTTTTVPVPETPPTFNPLLPRLDIDATFDPIQDRLASVVRVAIRLPRDLADGGTQLTPSISSIDPGGYVINLGVGEDCNGASQCRVSTFTARRSARTHPRVTSGGTPVPLPNGLDGMFLDATCGADCNNGFVTWIEGDVLYSVGSRLASGPEVLALAWSAIDSSAVAPQPPKICGPGAAANNGRVARSLTTEIDDGRQIHWLVVCSAAGTSVEVLREPGDVRWIDIDVDGFDDAIIERADGTVTPFAVGAGSPRAAIDTATSGRLIIEELRCADIDGDGRSDALDMASVEELQFINAVTVQRVTFEDVEGLSIAPC